MDSLDFSRLEKLTNAEKIDSHNSQLTNLRIHELEVRLDIQRTIMISNPTHDNIIACFGIIKSWFSYVQSIKQQYRENDGQGNFITKIKKIEDKMSKMADYVALMQHNLVGDSIRKEWPQLTDKIRGNTPWNKIECAMVVLMNEIIDDLRTLYQSMNFYFRTSRNNDALGGILGDLVNAKKKRDTKMNEGGEINVSSGPIEADGE